MLPIDARYGQLLNVKIKQELFRRIEDDKNCENWYGEAMLTASEKRALITKWVGNAYREFLSSKHDGLRYHLFQKKGHLIIAYWLDDIFVQPEGLPNHTVAPPSPLDLSSGALVTGNDAATEKEENESQEADDFEGEKKDFEMVDQQEEEERNIFDILISALM